MMVVVAVPGVAHQRVGDVREDAVEEGELLGQDAPLVDVLVHHECVGPHVVDGHGSVKDTMKVSEVSEQKDCTRQLRREVQQQMRQHNHICLMTNDVTSP